MRNIVVLFTFLAALQASAGGAVGNGGDVVFCEASKESPFEGYYSLDYLLEYSSTRSIARVESLDTSLDRIESLFESKLPELLPSFRDFRGTLFKENDFSGSRIWSKAAFGLVDLKDEEILTLLPENCRKGDKAQIVQAVIRLSDGRHAVVYKYVPKVTTDLAGRHPAQLSFLLIHEWLWDWSDDVAKNRVINYLFHAKHTESWSRDTWIENLYALGIVAPLIPIGVDSMFSDHYARYDWNGRCLGAGKADVYVYAASLRSSRGRDLISSQCQWLGMQVDAAYLFEKERHNFVGGSDGRDCLGGAYSPHHSCQAVTWGAGMAPEGRLVEKQFASAAMSFSEASILSMKSCKNFFKEMKIGDFTCEVVDFSTP